MPLGQRVHPRVARKLIGPVHGRENRARLLPHRDSNAQDHFGAAAADDHETAIAQLKARSVGRMNLGERLGDVAHKARSLRRARHGMPLIAYPASVEHERKGARRF